MIRALKRAMRAAVCWTCERTGTGEVIYRALGAPGGLRYAQWLRRRGAKIGERTTVNHQAVLYHGDEAMVEIGSDCSISYAHFVTHCGGDRMLRELSGAPINSSRGIVVGDRCVIGGNAMIGPGVVIADDCVVGFGAVVRKSLPAGVVVIGNPAVVVDSTAHYRAKQIRRADSWAVASCFFSAELIEPSAAEAIDDDETKRARHAAAAAAVVGPSHTRKT